MTSHVSTAYCCLDVVAAVTVQLREHHDNDNAHDTMPHVVKTCLNL